MNFYMKKKYNILVCLSSCLLLSLVACKEEQPLPANNKLEAKHYPADEYWHQRAYPDAFVDLDAYTTALEEARSEVSFRNNEAFTGDWTVQGPANLGGRINTIEVHPTDPDIIYVGFARGGAWKTIDGGQNWTPIFDEQSYLTIGDITLDPGDPNTVFIGTGDPNISSLPGIGNGVFKSTDGGDSWTHLGLEDQRIVSKVIIDPSNSDIIYVGTMGIPFEPTSDRGLYKSIDGGASWEQVLFISEQTGVIDLLINPENPQILYAAGWDRLRNNFSSTISGQGAKVYKTEDGGQNWTILTGGLPQEDQGRIGLEMSATDPEVIYAEYIGENAQLFGVFRTSDGGQNWTSLPVDEATGLSPNAMGGFGWYFGKIRVNPQNHDDILLLGVDLWRSLDGGQNWFMDSPPWWTYEVHADKHDLVFVPQSNEYDFLLATDGGLYARLQGTDQYADMENIPTNQFYRVAYNPHIPFNYYGGMQDNGSTGGNASFINTWPRIFGGDGFQMAFDPVDDLIQFAETQNGNIYMTADGGYQWENVSEVLADDARKNWDMPYMISQHESNVIYSGTFKAYKGYYFGYYYPEMFWDSISTDLTKGVLTSPRYHTISTLHESPLVQGLLYYGATDGNLTRTDDDGANWEVISDELPDRYVTDVKASPNFGDYVYVTHSGYKYNDYIPHVHRSTDRGETWEDISGDLPQLAVNDIYILPEHSDSIIFVATDGGVYGTINAGSNWERLGTSMPFVQVYDLEVNPTENTLIAGTFARSIMTYPLDSIQMPEVEDSVTQVVASPTEVLDLQIYPSPATDWVNIDLEQGAYQISIIDAGGMERMRREGTARRGEALRLPVTNLAEGMYFVRAKFGTKWQQGVFVKF
jgi:photosystem II stability/assembly factor-like uncharacterized protein